MSSDEEPHFKNELPSAFDEDDEVVNVMDVYLCNGALGSSEVREK
jgi:hypothetical protein